MRRIPSAKQKDFDYGNGYFGETGGGDHVYRAEVQHSWHFDCPFCGYGRIGIPAPEWFHYKVSGVPEGIWACLKCHQQFEEDVEVVQSVDHARTESGPDGSSSQGTQTLEQRLIDSLSLLSLAGVSKEDAHSVVFTAMRCAPSGAGAMWSKTEEIIAGAYVAHL